MIASHWDSYSAGCAAAGRVPSGDDWRVASYILVAGSDAEARERVYAPDSAYRYTFGYLYEVLKRSGRLANLKPRRDMRDEDLTVDAIIEGRVLYGSPETVASRLIEFRNRVGPFGTLLVTGVDWGGRNAAWGRESMQPPGRGSDADRAPPRGGAGGGVAAGRGARRPHARARAALCKGQKRNSGICQIVTPVTAFGAARCDGPVTATE